MAFSNVFGGQITFPAQLTYLEIDLDANLELSWPVEQAVAGETVLADIMDVTPDAAGRAITLPDASVGGPGAAVLFNNLGADPFTVLDFDGNVVGSVDSGEQWEFYLADNTTTAGVWRTFQFGTGTSSAVAAALAGAGLKAIMNTLNVKIQPRSSAVSPLVVADGDRAKVVQWTGGVGAGTLPDPAVVGSDWFVYLRNNGAGTWTITPAAGNINGMPTLALAPFSSVTLYSDGVNYYTLGLSTITPSNFDFTAINVAGSGNYVLAGIELNRIAYRLTGVLTGARHIIVPTTVQQYWVDNSTTGAFDLDVKTLAGSGVVVPQGQSRILYSDGTDVVAANDFFDPVPVTHGGTGLVTINQGDLLYASALNTFSTLVKDTNATRYLSNQGASNNPSWSQVNLANGVTGRLPYANITQGAATSVLGVTGNVVTDWNQIVGGAGQILRVNNAGNALLFGTIDLSNINSVTGILDETNGGTGIGSYAQGDMIYATAANTLGKLSPVATFLKFLANNGTNFSGEPRWITPQYTGNSQISADTTLVLSDSWRVVYHSSGSPHKLTIPANGTIPFEIGTYFGFCNPSASGNLTISIAGPDTITGHGQTDGTGDFIVIPPGYSGYCIKVLSTKWLLVTDAPPTVVTQTIYRGYVGADGSTGNRLPAGWSAVRNSTGNYTVTHNLGLSGGTFLSLGIAVFASAGNRTGYTTSTNTGNSFDIGITDAGAGSASDQAFSFIAMTN